MSEFVWYNETKMIMEGMAIMEYIKVTKENIERVRTPVMPRLP